MKKVAMMAAAVVLPFLGMADVMLWGVGSDAYVDGISIQTFLQNYTVDDDNFNAVRVKMVREGQTSYLGIWDTGSQMEWEGDWGVEVGDSGDGRWGAHWNQSSIPNYDDDVMEILFQMELGHNAWDYGSDDWAWTTLASSESVVYKDIVDKYTYERYSLDPMDSTPWMPTEFHTVPEPSSEMLILTGMALLLLSRPTHNETT